MKVTREELEALIAKSKDAAKEVFVSEGIAVKLKSGETEISTYPQYNVATARVKLELEVIVDASGISKRG